MASAVIQSLPPDFWNIRVTDAISVLLTLGLFVLYFRMKNIQDEQNRIQEKQNQLMSRQTDIMSADHRPRISRDMITADEDELTIMLSNYGNGPINDIHIQTVIYGQSTNSDGDLLIKKGFERGGTAVVPKWNLLTQEESDGQQFEMDYSTSSASRLEEGDDEIKIKSEIGVNIMTVGTQKYEVPFSEAMQRINREWETDTIAIEFWMIGVDVTQRPLGFWMGTFYDVLLNDELDLETAIRFGDEGDRLGDPVREDEGKSMMIIDTDSIEA